MVTKALRRNLLATTIIAGSLMSAPAFAQAPAAATPAEEDTIVVTGSLISNPNLSQSTPVLVTTAEDIALRQNNVAEEVLRDIPGIVPNVGSAVNNGNGGASYVDLRGLGSNRNIVLLDGNRIAPSGLVGRVDLNNIPLALVDRVDALTGGASTTYGADAISGVVNFITKRDFAGVEVSVGEKITEKGDGNYLRSDVTIGGNFDDGKGNAVLSIGYQESDPVYQGDRDFSVNNISSFSGTFGGSGTGVPARVTGTRPIDPLTGQPSINPTVLNGGTRQINYGRTGVTGGGVDGSATAGNYAPFNFNPYNIFQTPFRRYNMYAAARYELSDAVELYTRALFSKNTVNTIIAPSGSFGSSVTVNLNNPYLPSVLRNQFCAFNTAPVVAGVPTGYTPLYTTAQCAAAATATGTADPNYRTVTFNLSRRFTESGPRISEFSTTIFDYRLGARGAITDSINWDVAGAYGESENRQSLQGYVVTSRLRQALLANNTTSCINTANSCVPANVFGPNGSISAAASNFVKQESTTLIKTSLAQARALISGDFGLTIPFASDAVNFAVGAEYRKYGASQRADALAKTAGELGGAGGAAPDIDGGYEVYEAFGELVAPLIQDKPFFNELTAKGGIRYSSYTVNAASKPKYKTTTYKGELVWSPVRDIKFRAGYSRAVRAPNISELFTPVTTGLTSLSSDPCAGAAPITNANLRAVCLAQGAPSGTIGSILVPTAGQANVTNGGNLNVKPETSDSITAGVVLTPSFLPGFSFTADYYNIRVKGAISTPTPSDVINGCFANLTAASAGSAACAALRRNPVTGGLDGDPSTTPGLITQLSNLGRLRTNGIDVSANYRRDLGFTKLALTFSGNYTFNSSFKANQNDPASLDRDCTGVYSTNCGSLQPKFQWSQRTTFGFEGVDISVLWRHIDKFIQEPDDVVNGNGPVFAGTLPDGTVVDFRKIKAYDYFDFAARLDVTPTIELTLGVNNVFNRKPPVIGSTVGPTSYNSGNTYPSTYDSLGRSYAASARVRF